MSATPERVVLHTSSPQEARPYAQGEGIMSRHVV
jgi:hypothetical protein